MQFTSTARASGERLLRSTGNTLGRAQSSVPFLLVPAERSIALVADTVELAGVEVVEQVSLDERQALVDFERRGGWLSRPSGLEQGPGVRRVLCVSNPCVP